MKNMTSFAPKYFRYKYKNYEGTLASPQYCSTSLWKRYSISYCSYISYSALLYYISCDTQSKPYTSDPFLLQHFVKTVFWLSFNFNLLASTSRRCRMWVPRYDDNWIPRLYFLVLFILRTLYRLTIQIESVQRSLLLSFVMRSLNW